MKNVTAILNEYLSKFSFKLSKDQYLVYVFSITIGISFQMMDVNISRAILRVSIYKIRYHKYTLKSQDHIGEK